MKVVLLAPTPPPAGGIAGWTARMMNARLESGWQIFVIDEKVIGNRSVFGNASKRSYFVEWKRCRNIWKQLKYALRDDEVKVVHSCIPSTTLAMLREYVCACIARKRGRKFIIHLRCTVPNTTSKKVGRIILKVLCSKCDMIIALNRQSVKFLKLLTNRPIALIPNYVETTEQTSVHEIRPDVKRIVYVGGVIRSKGCIDMISVASMFPEIEFRFIGHASDEVKSASRGLNNVTLTGVLNKETVQAELKNADIFMFLTYFYGEGFSNALVEAMAAGLPCIVTDWAANADMIENKGGVVVPIRDPHAAAEAIKKMMSAELRLHQSQFNMKKVESAYSEKIVLSSYVDAYNSLVSVDNGI